MIAFLNSLGLVGCGVIIAFVLAIATGRVVEFRGRRSQVWAKRAESPGYYWAFVAVLGLVVAISLGLAALQTNSN